MFVSDILQEVPGGTGVGGVAIQIFNPASTASPVAQVVTHNGVDSGTGAGSFPFKPKGYWEYKTMGDPYGGIVWRATYNGQTREGSHYPTGPTGVTQMGEFWRLAKLWGNGIVPGDGANLTTTPVSGQLRLRMQPGSAVLGGELFVNYENWDSPAQPVPPTGGGGRWDLLVIECYPPGSALTPAGRTRPLVVNGVNGGGVPAPTVSANVVQVPVFAAYAGAGAGQYSATTTQYGPASFPVFTQPWADETMRVQGAGAVNLATTAQDVAARWSDSALLNGVQYVLEAQGSCMLFSNNAATSVEARLYLTDNAGIVLSSAYMGFGIGAQWLTANLTLAETVTGHGQPLYFAVQARRSNNTATQAFAALTTVNVRATPLR